MSDSLMGSAVFHTAFELRRQLSNHARILMRPFSRARCLNSSSSPARTVAAEEELSDVGRHGYRPRNLK